MKLKKLTQIDGWQCIDLLDGGDCVACKKRNVTFTHVLQVFRTCAKRRIIRVCRACAEQLEFDPLLPARREWIHREQKRFLNSGWVVESGVLTKFIKGVTDQTIIEITEDEEETYRYQIFFEGRQLESHGYCSEREAILEAFATLNPTYQHDLPY